MANPNPRDHRATGTPATLTRERFEQELRDLACGERLFDETAKGRRTFTVRELVQMPESMQRCIKSISVRPVKQDAGDGTADQVMDVTLWGKTRAFRLAGRAGMHELGSARK